ncbi:uncharacterized protein N7484_004558 [Penicillium longicatenatum]|uniref:uncharacterized protein n=1 Tax=Penicillium longicatenatum TaxID=1561947 RepID=UPI0025479DBC|nr:uncharacterized protein N7484_004558 [Penicillium longicatenatum]KAJ5650835.1 hypothetical protein N7484_004558 [Penicillium longicatenatum]
MQCDEGKPICTRCKHRPEKCKYEFKLSWTGGRPFKNRRQSESQSDSQSPPEAVNASASIASSQVIPPDRRPSTLSSSSASSGEWMFEGPMPMGASVLDLGTTHSVEWAKQEHSRFIPSEINTDGDLIYTTEPGLAERKPSTDASQVTTLSQSLARRYPFNKRDQQKKNRYGHPDFPDISPFTQRIHYALSNNPAQLSSSPESRFFLHHYINTTADVIFPLSLTGNPLREDLLQSAMSNPHLLNAFLACACSHYARRHENMPVQMESSIAKFTNAALNGLRRAMLDPKQAGKLETISTALALCTSDVISGDLSTWRIHLSGANKLILSAFQSSSEEDTKTPLETFVIKWYALLDIFAGVSGLRKSSNPGGRYWSSNDDDTYIDEWTGYSLDLIPIISRIGRMARIQQKRTRVMAVNDDSEDEEVDTQVREESLDEIRDMENLIYSLYNRTAHPSLVNHPDPATRKRAVEMQCIHRAFLYTALLHLYRRVQDLPKHHTKAVYAVHMVIETIQMIPRESSSNILTLWPVFTVGCETDDPVQRKIIEQRIAKMESFGMGNVETARQAMHAYWESGATERWDIFLENYPQDIVLF